MESGASFTSKSLDEDSKSLSVSPLLDLDPHAVCDFIACHLGPRSLRMLRCSCRDLAEVFDGSSPFWEQSARRKVLMQDAGDNREWRVKAIKLRHSGHSSGLKTEGDHPIPNAEAGSFGFVVDSAGQQARSLPCRRVCFGPDNCMYMVGGASGELHVVYPSLPPKQVDGAPIRITDIACGEHHTLAVSADAHSGSAVAAGSIWVWGGGAFGQLGLGDVVKRQKQPRNVLVPGASRILGVAAGAYHSVVRDEQGVLFSCGKSSSGQLGHESIGNPGNFKKISLILPEVENEESSEDQTASRKGICSKVVAAGHWTCALVLDDRFQGTVFTWGDGSSGQLDGLKSRNSSLPEVMPGLQQYCITDIASYAHGGAATDGMQVWTWGGGERKVANENVGEARKLSRYLYRPLEQVYQCETDRFVTRLKTSQLVTVIVVTNAETVLTTEATGLSSDACMGDSVVTVGPASEAISALVTSDGVSDIDTRGFDVAVAGVWPNQDLSKNGTRFAANSEQFEEGMWGSAFNSVNMQWSRLDAVITRNKPKNIRRCRHCAGVLTLQ